MDEDDGRALLAAYLPVAEPPETALSEVVSRAKAVRRRRRTVLASAASVAVVLVATGIALGSVRADGPPAAPAPTAPLSPSHPPASSCQDVVTDGNDAGARAWSRWVRGRLGLQPPGPGAAWFSRTCAEQTTSGFVPTHTHNRAEVALPDRPPPGETARPEAQILTATATRWERLPDTAGEPCPDSDSVEYVVCHHSTLADGSLVVQRDYYEIGVRGGRQAIRDVSRIFRDGRAVGLHLTANGPSPSDGAFARMARTLEELTAIVTDPEALQHVPRR